MIPSVFPRSDLQGKTTKGSKMCKSITILHCKTNYRCRYLHYSNAEMGFLMPGKSRGDRTLFNAQRPVWPLRKTHTARKVTECWLSLTENQPQVLCWRLIKLRDTFNRGGSFIGLNLASYFSSSPPPWGRPQNMSEGISRSKEIFYRGQRNPISTRQTAKSSQMQQECGCSDPRCFRSDGETVDVFYMSREDNRKRLETLCFW